MIISFGNNSLSPNEIYSLYFPDQINNYEDNFEIDVDKARKYSSKLLRQMLKHSIEFPLPSLCLIYFIIFKIYFILLTIYFIYLLLILF